MRGLLVVARGLEHGQPPPASRSPDRSRGLQLCQPHGFHQRLRRDRAAFPPGARGREGTAQLQGPAPDGWGRRWRSFRGFELFGLTNCQSPLGPRKTPLQRLVAGHAPPPPLRGELERCAPSVEASRGRRRALVASSASADRSRESSDLLVLRRSPSLPRRLSQAGKLFWGF